MLFQDIQQDYAAGFENKFRRFIKGCQYNDRGWIVKNVLARGLHIPHLALTVLCASANTTLGLGSACVSIALLGRVKQLNRYADVCLESLGSFLPHVYNDILGIVNPAAASSEEDIVSSRCWS